MAITGEALGGAMLNQGWTNQNLGVNTGQLTPNIEAGFGANSTVINPALQWNYNAWTMITEDSIATPAHPLTNQLWVTRVFVPTTFTCSKIDAVFTTAGTQTHWTVGLYNGAGVQQAVTADSTALIAVGLVSLSWVTPVVLTGGTFYWISSNITFSAAPQMAGCTGASAAALNAGLTFNAPEAATGATVANGAQQNPLLFGSGNMTLFTSEPFFALH